MKFSALLGILFLLLICNCSSRDYKAEFVEFNAMKIKTSLLVEIEKELESDAMELEQINYYYEEKDSVWIERLDTIKNGLYFEAIPKKLAYEIQEKYAAILNAEGKFIFMKNYDIKDGKSYYDLAIIKAENQIDILKFMNTQGVNYDIDNKMLIDKISAWDKMFKMEIIGADMDYLEAKIEKLPENLQEFANEVYEFCPDIIDQGIGDIELYIEDLKKNKTLFFWWD